MDTFNIEELLTPNSKIPFQGFLKPIEIQKNVLNIFYRLELELLELYVPSSF